MILTHDSSHGSGTEINTAQGVPSVEASHWPTPDRFVSADLDCWSPLQYKDGMVQSWFAGTSHAPFPDRAFAALPTSPSRRNVVFLRGWCSGGVQVPLPDGCREQVPASEETPFLESAKRVSCRCNSSKQALFSSILKLCLVAFPRPSSRY